MKSVLRTLVLLCCLSLSIRSFAEEFGYQDKVLGINFPKTLGTLTYQKPQTYEKAELGYGVSYQGEDLMKADIYIYDKGMKTIPDDVTSQILKDEMREVIDVLRVMERMGKYRDVETLEEGVFAANSKTAKRQYLWARFGYAQNPEKGVSYQGPRISDAYLTATGGKFVKIRLTYKESNAAAGEKTSREFVEEFSTLLER